MTPTIKTPKQALTPAFLKQKPERKDLELFKKELNAFLNSINENETEEYNKNLMKTFLNEAYYKNYYEINVYNDSKNKIRVDFAIKQKEKTIPEVLIEIKRPGKNQSEMPTIENLNKKALHELLLYYMSERTINNNISLRHLIVTNLYEWFVFDAKDFYELFYSDRAFKDTFLQYAKNQLEGGNTKYFYDEIANPVIARLTERIPFIHFDIRDYKDLDAENEDFIALYKFLSPVHLLKRDATPDNNKLNREFYNELLHILGLTETKSEGKIKIERKTKNRNEGSLLELTIAKLETADLSQMNNNSEHHDCRDEQLFAIALSLVITWTNRILFIKLLEAQLLKYHDNDADYSFLSTDKIDAFSELDALFFQILAQTADKRPAYLDKFKRVPYLNSSLFEETDAEKILKISGLYDRVALPLYEKSVLADKKYDALQYLLQFLNAYNFSGKQQADENPDKLISAAVLGLIFEKINGYKDGSFFTPSFITMYICRETIGRAVISKFNSAKGWKCNTLEDLHNHIGANTDEIGEANAIFNSLRICDPAVGSGHFLVSALNEMLYLKAELGILCDKNGKRLKNCQVTVENDELTITDNEGHFFAYNPKNVESQRIQETFFHEKQTIIENCLFGVDINPNSVKICQLRLWIELLKHAYYLKPGFSQDLQNYQDFSHNNLANLANLNKIVVKTLQTLPNIDINIKCGNSLMSRFDLADKYHDIPGLEQRVKQATKKYKEWVALYKTVHDKEAKRQIVKNIDSEKAVFYQINNARDADYQNLQKAQHELALHTQSFNIFEEQTNEWNDKTSELTEKLKKLETAYNEKIRGCFEWRFEFPEVLDENGNFAGFDVVMGNPPYMILTKNNSEQLSSYNLMYKSLEKSSSKNIFVLFIERGIQLLSKEAQLSFIVPEGLFKTRSYERCVEIMEKTGFIDFYSTFSNFVFENAVTGNLVFVFNNYQNCETRRYHFDKNLSISEITESTNPLFDKIELNSVPLKSISTMFKGMAVKNRNSVISNKFTGQKDVFLLGKNISKWSINSKYFTDYENLEIVGGTKKLEKHQQVPRILIRRTGDILCCAYLETPSLTESTLYSCWSLSENVDNIYLLALLNSKLLNYYNKEKNITNQQAFPQILMTDLENLPIKISENQQPIIALVNQILLAKEENPAADTRELEREIDGLVYGVYGVTEEEIGIIENK